MVTSSTLDRPRRRAHAGSSSTRPTCRPCTARAEALEGFNASLTRMAEYLMARSS